MTARPRPLLSEVAIVLAARGAREGSLTLRPRDGSVRFTDAGGNEVTLHAAAVRFEAREARRAAQALVHPAPANPADDKD